MQMSHGTTQMTTEHPFEPQKKSHGHHGHGFELTSHSCWISSDVQSCSCHVHQVMGVLFLCLGWNAVVCIFLVFHIRPTRGWFQHISAFGVSSSLVKNSTWNIGGYTGCYVLVFVASCIVLPSAVGVVGACKSITTMANIIRLHDTIMSLPLGVWMNSLPFQNW